MFFQVRVAALVYLTAFCILLTERHVLRIPPVLEAYDEFMTLMGKRRDIFYLHTHGSKLDVYDIKFKLPVLIN